jgi:hypothetical protein
MANQTPSVISSDTVTTFIADFRSVIVDTRDAVWEKASRWGGSTPCTIFGVSIQPGGTVDCGTQSCSCANSQMADRMLQEFDNHFIPLAEQALLCPPGQSCNRQHFIDQSKAYLESVKKLSKALNKWANTSYLQALFDSFYRAFLQMLDQVIDVAVAVGERVIKRIGGQLWIALAVGAVGLYYFKKGSS